MVSFSSNFKSYLFYYSYQFILGKVVPASFLKPAMKEKVFQIKEGGHVANIKIEGWKYAIYESDHYGRFILSVMDFKKCLACRNDDRRYRVYSHFYKFKCRRGLYIILT